MSAQVGVGVGFDIDHTLAIDNKLERVAFLHLLDRIVAEGGRPLGTLQEEIERIDALLAEQRAGAFTIDEAVHRFSRERGGETHDDYAAGFRRLATSMAETFVIPDPEAKGTLDALAASGTKVAVLSNGWSPLQNVKARRAGFGGTVIASADLGVQKPHPQAFAALCRELRLPPDRCFYVGDDPKADIAGALAAGLRAVWIDNEGKTYPSNLPAPTHVVHRLSDVLGLVDAVRSQKS
jgi:putative hydrolase of the HAD superfamily